MPGGCRTTEHLAEDPRCLVLRRCKAIGRGAPGHAEAMHRRASVRRPQRLAQHLGGIQKPGRGARRRLRQRLDSPIMPCAMLFWTLWKLFPSDSALVCLLRRLNQREVVHQPTSHVGHEPCGAPTRILATEDVEAILRRAPHHGMVVPCHGVRRGPHHGELIPAVRLRCHTQLL